MRRLFLARAVAALVILANGHELGSSQAPVLVIEAPRELEGQAARVRALEQADFTPTLALLGLREFGEPIRIALAPESSPLAHHAPSWVSGYALGVLGEIVLFPARVPSYPDRNLEALVQHEVAHVLIARAARGGSLPRWFDEGLATVAAREWGIEDRARFALAVIGRGPRSLGDLEAGFTDEDATVARSYAMSAAFVRHLLREHGTDGAARMLSAVAAGATFGDAFRSTTGETLRASETGFFGRETVWGTWVPFLTSTTALWMAITLLALWAIRRRRERDAAQREAWEQTDRALAGAALRPDDAEDEKSDPDPPPRYN